MKRELLITRDGSPTVSIPEMGVTYHSIHGAVQESMHVFINEGLNPLLKKKPLLRIFEMGFGTGLNALLTARAAAENQQKIEYTVIEKFPLHAEELKGLQYGEDEELLAMLHDCSFNSMNAITPYFSIMKLQGDLIECSLENGFDLVYYDAFAPAAQPELWTKEVFEKLFKSMLPGGVLVTYCSKSDVRRAIQAAGFVVEKRPGPPGKREMLRAIA